MSTVAAPVQKQVKTVEVRRSTRKQKETEKELGEERQRYVRQMQRRNQIIHERTKGKDRDRRRMVNLVLTVQKVEESPKTSDVAPTFQAQREDNDLEDVREVKRGGQSQEEEIKTSGLSLRRPEAGANEEEGKDEKRERTYQTDKRKIKPNKERNFPPSAAKSKTAEVSQRNIFPTLSRPHIKPGTPQENKMVVLVRYRRTPVNLNLPTVPPINPFI